MESSRPLRVLHVIPSFWPATAYGGPIESVRSLCAAEADAGARVTVLTTDADGRRRLPLPDGTDVRLSDGFRVRYFRRWGGDSCAPGLLRALPGEVSRSDVVHLTAVYSFPTIPTLIVSRAADKPLVWTPRGSLQGWEGASRPRLKGAWRRLCALVMPRRTVLHVTSDAEGEASRRAFPTLPAEVIPNGVELPPSGPAPRGGRVLHLVFLGRLHPIKGLENLVEACAVCRSRGWSAWRLSVAGDGEEHYLASLRARVERAGMGSHVEFVGAVHGERKEAFWRSADLLVVPSHSENFSMVVAEALAHGVPVVASTGTPWKALSERGCGWWVSNAPEELASALLAARDADRETMGRRGRDWMRADFRWDTIAARMIDTYRRLAVLETE